MIKKIEKQIYFPKKYKLMSDTNIKNNLFFK